MFSTMAIQTDERKQSTYAIRHHPIDEAAIVCLALVCAAFFISELSGINLLDEIKRIIPVDSARSGYWIGLAGLLLAVAAYSFLIYKNRRFELRNASLEQGVDEARRHAHASLDSLERTSKHIKAG